MSFTRTYKAEQTHKSNLESMMGQVLKGQQKMSAVLAEKLDFLYSDLHDKKPPEAEKATINLDEEEEESKEDVEIDRQEGNNVDRPPTVNIDRPNENNVN
ncbi:hypothetical protein F2Q69_00007810 [Brassica cretica]|uniref:Uncharacterized protein n=1 Tax=Brassica cretica TaxID=69181 RepID=A0A8S9PLI6_BRACR|nr:hypothetical protein F2Q69_00007810 [Brassica cretica]